MTLPIHPYRERIAGELARAGALILSAPTGSGKSTQVPRFLAERVQGKIFVLEPRRVAARALAARVAAEDGTPLGAAVGYQVRFDSRPGSKIVFQTYGIFVQRLMRDPYLEGVGAVLLDEFHERTLEADLSLAWLRSARRGRRKDLKVVVMSATLDAEVLARYLPGAARLEVPGRLFPVKTTHLPADAREGPERGALRALEFLAAEGLDGSVLVFLPGMREIRRAREVLGDLCRRLGLEIAALHGSMKLDEQRRVLEDDGTPRVVLATNVAETGLTIPGVTAVIDSGLHRLASYNPGRDINALTLCRVSLANAAQRTGRAGRTAPGRCVRLWSSSDERGMAASVAPEVERLELSSLLLQAASLPAGVEWLSPPGEAALAAARGTLKDLKAVDAGGRVTARGKALLRYPAPPRVAAVLEEARSMGLAAYERAAAMAAIFEAERRPDRPGDLSESADDLLLERRGETPREAIEIFRQFKRLGGDFGPDRQGSLERVWLAAFPGRVAAWTGGAYRLLDGRSALLKAAAPLILALDLQEKGGRGEARRAAVALHLPVSTGDLQAAFPGECIWENATEFDSSRGRVVSERRLVFRGLVIERKEAPAGKEGRREAAELWAERFASGELKHPGFDAKAGQLVSRIRVARSLYPDLGLPPMDADDWRLIYGEVCAGRNTLKDIERVPLAPHILSYLGKPLADFLAKALPVSRKLPSGRIGRLAYFEGRPAELSARLGDFLKMTGTLSLCEGRLPVLFDILAPNYRTVQKTNDLASFWKNTYPEIKKELKRRYPKHPWP